ncbi:RHS repeat domain-containing protein [Rivularia sp. PCC 7116]|uniref:RHS repeat domain-containing protein n=1 Tax=Rivularia sp. PCC 7116 TaxID=373994 RepID=UPI00030CC25A|nr:RHS repeat-associated core domain-containing protein [Rivularia sp. PCC 7116]
MLTDGKYNYSYDDEGNRTQRVEIATGEITEYSWDYRNRLTEVVVKDTNGNVIKTAGYTYDMFDRRIAKEVDADGDGVATASIERFVYDGEHIALTFDGDGNLTHRYLHGPQVDQILASENAQGEVLWALTDNQGTVRDVVDNNGTVVNHITYDSFGRVTGESNENVDFRFGYTGREFDEETGQYYYRARYYDAAVGQFISEDPIGFEAGDPNFYRYVNNSPANFTDPTGEILDALYKNNTLYNYVNKADQFAAGFGDAVSFGLTTKIREIRYGETATRNHSGGLFTAGQIFGTAASTAVSFGVGAGAKGGGWAIRAAKYYTVVGDITGVVQSTNNLIKGCFTPIDLLGYAPAAGYIGGRIFRGLRGVDGAGVIGRLQEGDIVSDLLFGARVGEGLPGPSGAKISSRPTPAQLELLTDKHNVEFAVTYKLGSGPNGRGGQYFLHSGKARSVEVPLEADSMLIYHTHPGGTAAASQADKDLLETLELLGSPQRSSQIVPSGKDVIRFDKNRSKF